MNYKIFIKEIPKKFTVWQWIMKTTDIKKFISTMASPVKTHVILDLIHDIDIKSLVASTEKIINTFGYHGWKNNLGEDQAYGGLSLTYNPDYCDNSNDNSQTLGTYRNQKTEYFFDQTHNFNNLQNTYYDTYGFRKLSPCAELLNEFLLDFDRTLIRSRIAILNPQYLDPKTINSWGWHRDESVFENIRINIPIQTDEQYLFQLLGKSTLHLKYGHMYSWDTNISHRIFPCKNSNKNRIHIVLGFSPWFDYDPLHQCWCSNEFYGKIHPFEMLISGLINKKITGANHL